MIEDLADHPLFADLTAAEQRAVRTLCQWRQLSAGDHLVEQGGRTPGLHLLVAGHVAVTVHVADREHEVAVLGPGTVVGEVSLLEGDETAGADVTALTDVTAAVVPLSAADELLAIDAVALQLDALARRRRATNRALQVPPVDAGRVDGRPLELRPLWPEDWRQLATGTDRVSAESLRMRFFNIPPLTERTFRRLTTTDHHDQFAWGAFVDGELVGVGRHALQAEHRRVAELAVLVADDLQGNGIATRLVGAVAVAADAHGAEELSALARASNTAVRRLLARFGAVWQVGVEDGTVTARWPVVEALAAVDDPVLLAGARATATTVLGDVLDA